MYYFSYRVFILRIKKKKIRGKNTISTTVQLIRIDQIVIIKYARVVTTRVARIVVSFEIHW